MNTPESLFEAYSRAVFQKDVAAFVSIFEEKVLVFDMWEPWTYEGLAAWREMAEGWFASLGTERVVVTFEDVRVDVVGEIATATAFVRFAAISQKDEELRFLQNRLTWVARKKGESWKVTHQHTSSPINGETMKVVLTR